MQKTAAAIQFLWLLPSLLTSAPRRISMDDLHDKIRGGWAGQMIGVSFGAPTEFKHLGEPVPKDKFPAWNPAMVSEALVQDDLYTEMTFAAVLDRKGPDAKLGDFAASFQRAGFPVYHSSLAVRRNLDRHVPAEVAGSPRYNAHANDIDFQIQSDFIGLMAPGMPRSATELAWRVGHLLNYGEGVYGGVFVACMYSAAFFEADARRVVEDGLACLPPQSPYAQLIADVLAWYKQHPGDWLKSWQLLTGKWDRDDPCPAGALTKFNIDAKLNGGYLALGLLYGQGDFSRTIELATMGGQDSDCNPSTAGGILGAMIGYRRIPEEWKSGIPALADKPFLHTEYSFNGIVDSTERRAIQLIKRAGGNFDNGVLTVDPETPDVAPLEKWIFGVPAERIDTPDPRMNWKGEWSSKAGTRRDGHPRVIRTATARSAELSVQFEGTGAILCGPYLDTGGKADVYLDGTFDRTVDVYYDWDGRRGNESIWHVYGLKSGKHSVRLVVRGEPYPGSKGTAIVVEDLIVFR